MGKTGMEIYNDKLLELGTAMMALLNGQVLAEHQIEIIKGANYRQKVLSLELVAINNLRGQEYTNYCHNKVKLNRR